jgi:hypothetical protein
MTVTTGENLTERAALNQELYFEIRAAIRKATKSDEYADLASEPGYALRDILYTLEAAKEDVRELLGHEHQWNENDYCSICGADGRA